MDMQSMRMMLSPQFWRMAILWPLALLYSYLLLHWNAFRPRPRPQRWMGLGSGQPPICVITGATSGLGAAAARALSWEGFYVVLVGRSMEFLSETMESIRKKNTHAQLKAFEVDMLSTDSIIEFKIQIQDWLSDSNLHPSVQLLINNAGILATSSGVTTDRFDRMMKTNYVGAFMLTNLLLPLLRNSPLTSRIVNVTSFTHRCVTIGPSVTEQALKCWTADGNYQFAQIYEYSKFYMLLFTYELHRKFYLMNSSKTISVMAADPGAVETNIMRELPRNISRFAFSALRLACLLQSPESGVSSIIDAALAPPEKSGEYFFGGNGRTISSSVLSYNSKLADDLWDSSMKLFQETVSIEDERYHG